MSINNAYYKGSKQKEQELYISQWISLKQHETSLLIHSSERDQQYCLLNLSEASLHHSFLGCFLIQTNLSVKG